MKGAETTALDVLSESMKAMAATMAEASAPFAATGPLGWAVT